jgi:predicted CXXCH cytochrome family protein
MSIVKRPIKEEQRAEANRLETNPPIRGSLEQPLWWKNSTLELSRCYQESHGRLTCSTCHSTHHTPPPGQEKAAYRAACLSCHKEDSCTLKPGDAKRAAVGDYCVDCHMEKRPVAGIAHSNDTKHRIVRYPGQPLPEIAFEQPKPDLPGLLWLNRPAGEEGRKMPDLSQLDAYWTAARKDPTLWPYWFRKLDELSKSAPENPQVLNALGAVALAEKKDNAKAADYFERALKQGSEEPTTFLNLATAFGNLGRRKWSWSAGWPPILTPGRWWHGWRSSTLPAARPGGRKSWFSSIALSSRKIRWCAWRNGRSKVRAPAPNPCGLRRWRSLNRV